MKFMEGEVLQSWIYRCLLVNGVTDFSSVINTKGNWILSPYFPLEHLDLFTFSSDQELFDLFVQSSMGLRDPMSISPWAYASEIKKYFRRESKYMLKGGSVPITYCTLCIRESLAHIGFGYIKSKWLFGDRCEIHNTKLFSLNSKSRADTLLQLGDILSGIKSVQRPSPSINKSSPMNLIGSENVMPCFIMKFYWEASNRYDNQYFEGMHYDFFNSNGKRKQIDSFLQGEESSLLWFARLKLREYRKRFSEELDIFFENKAEEIVFNYGISKPDSFTVTLIKDKNSNCSKCYKWSKGNACPINPIVASFKVCDPHSLSAPARIICDHIYRI